MTVRDAQTGAVRFQVPHGQYVLSVAYSPDGKQIATGSSDNTIQILDAANGNVLQHAARATPTACSRVRFSPDGRQLLSGSYDNTARLWDIATGTELQALKGHSWWVWAAEFSPDGNRIVTAGQDGKAIVWQKREQSSRQHGATANRLDPPAPAPGPLATRSSPNSPATTAPSTRRASRPMASSSPPAVTTSW